jgi:hypothetical protein
VSSDEHAAGRAAAERLSDEWPDVRWVPEAPEEAWANAAVERFSELILEQRAIFRASQKGGGRGARSLSPRPFQGILEAIQNADDLGAAELRIAIRARGRKHELLMVHDGERVQLHHVGAMVLPWLTTKEDDPDASGRFGIGQQTLQALGGPLEVHCAPFQFRIDGDRPVVCGSVPPIAHLYAPERHETLFVVPLLKTVDLDKLAAFVDELGSGSLLFLRSVRRLSVFNLESGKRTIDHRLVATNRTVVVLQVGRKKLEAERLDLRDPRSRRQYVRYIVERALSKDEPRRHEKATAKKTPLGVAVPIARREVGRLYDRLPMPLKPGFPFSLNAQFDPDAARTTLLENEWNANRIRDLGELVAAAGFDAFERDPASAWGGVPLGRDVTVDADSWLGKQLREAIVVAAQRRFAEDLRLSARGGRRALADLVFEERRLDGLLTADDQERLRPELAALVEEQRDGGGRWREVLEELGVSQRIETTEALEVFDQEDLDLGPREPEWFVALASAAIDDYAFNTFLYKRSVLLADGSRIEPPGANDPRSLVYRVNPDSLAAALGVALLIHPVYLEEGEHAKRVVSELRDGDILLEEVDSADAALQVLARDYDLNTIGRVRVDDAQLLSLRDAFERLGEDEQKTLGPKVGRNIELRTFAYDDDAQVVEEWISPAEAYLPTTIDRETDSFAKAAAQTPGLHWLDPGYARTLKRTGGRKQLGAQRFLVRLGAATAPRLVRPDNEREVYKRDARPASKVSAIERPELQMLEITPLSHYWQRHLLDDRWSPDLDAVIEDICTERSAKRRRQRGLFLLGVLARAWDRHYAGHEHARAVFGSDGYWRDEHDVIASWLARAASEPWLPSSTGAMRAPIDLCLSTEASKLAYKDDRSMFLAKVDDQVLRSPAVEALRLRRGPSASSLVERLGQLRSAPLTAEAEAEAKTAYRLLALYCPPEGRRPVDDMSVRELREAFAGGRGKSGLLLIDGDWHPPKEVFAGEHIFGRHRPFVPRSTDLEPLWRALELREPDGADCIAVLRELSCAPLNPEDRGTVLQTMRSLAAKLDSISPQLRSRLRRLPLWTGDEWWSERPIYAFEDDSLAGQAASQVAVWESGFSSFAELESLFEALEVTALRLDDFTPVALDGHGVVTGDHLRPQFALAVEHLRDELARGDQALHDSLLAVTSWRELCTAPVIVQENLKLALRSNEPKAIIVSADALMLREPLALVVRSEGHVGTAGAGGRAISSLFSGDRQKVAWAWVSMWLRAGSGVAPEQILLSTDKGEDEEDQGTERLIRLQGQARTRGVRTSKGKGGGAAAGKSAETTTVTMQPLKDLSEYEPDEGTIVNAGQSRAGVILPTRDRKAAASSRRSARTGSGVKSGGGSTHPPRTIPAPVTDREQLALDVVRKALRLDAPQIADLRKRHGLGADAMDELRQFYELKMESSGEFPKEVTLQGSQLDAAQDDDDFFLAVVAGLSDDSSDLRVRFIFNPLDRLAVRIKGEATLSGVPDIEALEYGFKKEDRTS